MYIEWSSRLLTAVRRTGEDAGFHAFLLRLDILVISLLDFFQRHPIICYLFFDSFIPFLHYHFRYPPPIPFSSGSSPPDLSHETRSCLIPTREAAHAPRNEPASASRPVRRSNSACLVSHRPLLFSRISYLKHSFEDRALEKKAMVLQRPVLDIGLDFLVY